MSMNGFFFSNWIVAYFRGVAIGVATDYRAVFLQNFILQLSSRRNAEAVLLTMVVTPRCYHHNSLFCGL
jgi:hypothetical protein